MKRLNLFLTLAISAASITVMNSDALAAPSRVMKLMHEQALKNKAVVKDKGLCTNFTGDWTGTCVDGSGEPFSEWLKIRQWDCSSITIEGDGYTDDLETNSLKRIGSTTFNYLRDFNATIGVEWNIARTILTTKAVGNFQTSGSMETGTIEGRESFEIKDNQLITKSQYNSRTTDSQTVNTSIEECTYSK